MICMSRKYERVWHRQGDWILQLVVVLYAIVNKSSRPETI